MKRRTFLGALVGAASTPYAIVGLPAWANLADLPVRVPTSACDGGYVFIMHPDWVAELQSSGALDGVTYQEVEHLTGCIDNPALLK